MLPATPTPGLAEPQASPVSTVEILVIAVALAMDALAVSIGIGTGGGARGFRPIFRLAFHFGLFQALMPVLGWAAGTAFARAIAALDHWIALGLLTFVGLRMIRSGLSPDGSRARSDPSRGWTLLALSVAVSIDALAVGLSLAMLHVRIVYPSIVIGVVTGALSWLGLTVGHRLGSHFGARMEIAGGLLLIAIGVRILLEHLAE